MLIASFLDTLFKVLGAFAGIVILLLLLGAVFLYFKWRIFWKRVAHAMETPTPSEIHLNEDLDPEWLGDEDLEPTRRALEAAGFRLGRAYEVREMPEVFLCSLWHSRWPIVGALGQHPAAGEFIDLFARFPNGREVTVTNASSGSDIDRRPEADKEWLSGATVEALLLRFQEKVAAEGGAPIVVRDEEEFRREYEDAYRRDMAWRNGRGGVTEAEVERIAVRVDGATPASIAASFLEAKRQEVARLHEECLAEARRLGVLATDDVRLEEGRVFILAESLHRPAVAEYLATALSLGELPPERAAAFAAQAETNAALLERFTQALSPSLRPQRIGAVTAPIPAEIWSLP